MIKNILSVILSNYFLFLVIGFIKEGISVTAIIKALQIFLMANIAPILAFFAFFTPQEPNRLYIGFGVFFLLIFVVLIVKWLPTKYMFIWLGLFSICWGMYGFIYLTLNS